MLSPPSELTAVTFRKLFNVKKMVLGLVYIGSEASVPKLQCMKYTLSSVQRLKPL